MADTKIKTSNIEDSAVTHDKLHVDMDLTGKTVQVPTPTAASHPATKNYVDTEIASVTDFAYNGATEVLTIDTADGSSFTADISGLASETYVDTAVSNLVDSAPGTLDTLNELAAALGDDANFATTVSTNLGNKVDKINITGATVGSSTQIPVITYNAQGQITSTTTTAVAGIDSVTFTNGTLTIAAGDGTNYTTDFDTRYFTETEANANFLGINAKAADADTLDGLNSTQFLRSDAADAISGTSSTGVLTTLTTTDALAGTGAVLRLRTAGRGDGIADISIFSVANNTTDLFNVRNDGNVGIGTTDPERLLTLSSDNPMIQIEATGGNGKQWSIISSDDTTGASGASGPGHFVIYDDSTSTPRFTITDVGNVGIGTDDPTAKLQVFESTANTALDVYTNDVTSAVTVAKFRSYDNTNGEVDRFKIKANGDVSFTDVTGADNTIWQPAYKSFGIGNQNPALVNLNNGTNLVVGDGNGNRGATIYSSTTGEGRLYFIDSYNGAPTQGGFVYDHSDDSLAIRTNNEEQVVIKSNGTLVNNNDQPTIRPTLNLDFANSKELDPRITFYRDSIATYYDSKGVLRYANTNTPRFDHDPVTGESKGLLIEEARTNIVPNSTNLETFSTSRCEKIRNYALAPDGTMSAVFIARKDSSGTRVIHDFNVFTPAANSTYAVSCYAKSVGSDYNFHMELGSGANNAVAFFDLSTGTATTANANGTMASVTHYIEDVGGGWYRCVMIAVHGASWDQSTNLAFYDNNNTDAASGILVWGPQVEQGSFATSYIPSDDKFTSRSSVATYHDENGILRTAPANSPRYGYKYDGRKWVETGLILEGAATNLYTYSPRMDLSVTGSTTDTPDYATAPDGSKTALRIVWNNGYAYRYYPNIHGNDVVHTHSFYIKPISGTNDARHSIGGTPGSASWTFNFDSEFTEQVGGNGTTYAYTYEKLADGWWRVSVTFSLPNSTGYVELQWSGSGGGVEYYLWGMQIETGYIPTSFIYTDITSGGLTRSADVASSVAYTRQEDSAQLKVSDWYGSDGTLYTDFNMSGDATGTYGNIIQLVEDNSTRWGFLTTNNDNGLKAITYDAPNLTFPTIGTLTYGDNMKIAMTSPTGGQFTTSINGASTVVTSAAAISNPTLMYIGKTISDNNNYNGTFAKISYYPSRLSNAELQALTENN